MTPGCCNLHKYMAIATCTNFDQVTIEDAATVVNVKSVYKSWLYDISNFLRTNPATIGRMWMISWEGWWFFKHHTFGGLVQAKQSRETLGDLYYGIKNMAWGRSLIIPMAIIILMN